MTHYLRKNGKTIADVETSDDKLSCVVCIRAFSDLLLSDPVRQHQIIEDFDDLQEMRTNWFEVVKQAETPMEYAERKLRHLAGKYRLQYVTD